MAISPVPPTIYEVVVPQASDLVQIFRQGQTPRLYATTLSIDGTAGNAPNQPNTPLPGQTEI